MIRPPPRSALFPCTTLFRSAYYGAYDGQRFSPLSQIDATNVRSLRSAWVFEAGVIGLIASPALYSLEATPIRSEEHTSELQSRQYLVCRLLLEKKKIQQLLETPINY